MGDVYECASNGLSEEMTENCTDTQYCDEGDDPGECRDMVCTPTELYCDANVLRKCDNIGSGGAVEKDCNPDGVCDLALENCVYTGELGGDGQSTRESQKRGNFFNCTKDVKVIEFAQKFNLSANTDLTWAIYEAIGNTTTYTKIFSKTATVTPNGVTLYSTGAILVDLKNGRKYLFLTAWNGSRIFFDGANVLTHPINIGFGTSFAGHTGNNLIPDELVSPAENVYVYNQQIKFVE
jgi:hypothetical protein